MDRKDLKQRVFDSNLELVRRGLVIYTWGNVSAIDREDEVVIIKPRGIEYDDMEASDMSVVDYDGNLIEGTLLPSVDLDIHLALYERFPQLGGIAHTHSTYATAWAQACRDIPVLGTTHADHFYGPVPCTRMLQGEDLGDAYERNTGSVLAALFREADPIQVPAGLVAGHGPFTWGKTPEDAVQHSVILEEVARMAYLAHSINLELQPIPQSLLDKHYLRKYGPSAYFYQEKE
jgi:L-ribulose-5-phosphate 4-epimerase